MILNIPGRFLTTPTSETVKPLFLFPGKPDTVKYNDSKLLEFICIYNSSMILMIEEVYYDGTENLLQ